MTWKLELYRGLYGLGSPTIRGTFLGVPILRTLVFWGLYWGPPIWGNYPVSNHLINSLLAPIASEVCSDWGPVKVGYGFIGGMPGLGVMKFSLNPKP